MTVPPMSLSPEPRRMAGSEIGILMLDTRFPRPLGDIGNPASFAFPVRYHRVAGATPARVVTQAQRARALLPDFISGARALERAGVAAITTSCGFLGPVQQDLAAAVSVPVLTSPLFLLPLARLSCGNRPVGVVTAHAGHLSAEHLSACGIDPRWDVPVIGLEHAPAFRDAILGNASDLDPHRIEAEVVAACRALQMRRPDLGALVFECTNLPPYRAAVRRATGLGVFDCHDLIALLRGGACG